MDIRVSTRRTVASTGQRSRRLALIGAAALLIAACLPGHPARFIFARNDSGHETRVRFSEGGIVRVYRLPVGFDGLVRIIDELFRPSVEILDSSCTLLGPAPDMEDAGGHLLQVGPGNEITARETALPQVFEMPHATELFGECGSTQAGPGGEPTGGTRDRTFERQQLVLGAGTPV
jgi:hypothetical protein